MLGTRPTGARKDRIADWDEPNNTCELSLYAASPPQAVVHER